MNENQVTALLQQLLLLWEKSVTREETLKLILKEKVPDWRYQYRDYWNDAEAMEIVMKTTYPMREIVKAAVLGTLSDPSLQQAIQAAHAKPPLT